MSQPKFYISNEHTGLGTWHTTTAGSLIGQLKLALCDGFNLKSVSTLSRTGSVANVYVSTGHGYSDKQVVLIAGASETEYNGEFVITYVDANNFTYTVTGTPATPATGTITAKAASLGWTAIYSTSDTLIVESPAGEGCLYRFYEPVNGVDPVYSGRIYTGLSPLFRAVEVRELSYADVSGNYIETCRGYIYKGVSGAGSQNAHWMVVGDDRGFHVLVQDPYDVYSAGTYGLYNHRYQGYYFGELYIPQTYAEVPLRSGMLCDVGYSQAANYGYDNHSPIGTSARASSSPTGNGANYWWRTGKSFAAHKQPQPLTIGAGTGVGEAWRLHGIHQGWPVMQDPWYTGSGQGVGRHFFGPFTGQQMVHLSSPWMIYNGSYIVGNVPGLYTVNWANANVKGFEFMTPFAARGATNRTALVVRGFTKETSPSSTGTTPVNTVGVGQFLGSGGEGNLNYAFDLTGEWR